MNRSNKFSRSSLSEFYSSLENNLTVDLIATFDLSLCEDSMSAVKFFENEDFLDFDILPILKNGNIESFVNRTKMISEFRDNPTKFLGKNVSDIAAETKPLPAKAGRFDAGTDLKSVFSTSACSACKLRLFTV